MDYLLEYAKGNEERIKDIRSDISTQWTRLDKEVDELEDYRDRTKKQMLEMKKQYEERLSLIESKLDKIIETIDTK